LADDFHGFEQITRRASQPIQFPNHDDVVVADLIKHPVKLGAIATNARNLFLKGCVVHEFKLQCVS
jgi:hypothetical protein